MAAKYSLSSKLRFEGLLLFEILEEFDTRTVLTDCIPVREGEKRRERKREKGRKRGREEGREWEGGREYKNQFSFFKITKTTVNTLPSFDLLFGVLHSRNGLAAG